MTKLWMMVTNDKYELPMAVADSAEELARMTGTTANVIYSAVSHAKKLGYKSIYVKVEIEEGE